MNLKKQAKLSLIIGSLLVSMNAAAAVVDTIDASSGVANASPNYFVPGSLATYDPPYYRGAGEDWSWKHNAITTPYTTASLSISAFDVDFPDEVDEIFGWETSTNSWVSIGVLKGASDIYSFTTFDLGSSWATEISTGLAVMMTIDNNDDGWFVTLAKSVLSTDGAPIGNPNPGTVPVPAAAWLLGSAVLGFLGMRRKNQA